MRLRVFVVAARLVGASPEEVFAAFTEPRGQEAFYGWDDPGWIVRSECDLRVGGVWTVEFGPSQVSCIDTGTCLPSAFARLEQAVEK